MTETHVQFWSMDTPVGPIMIAPCMHPEAAGERPDIPLSRQCEVHHRTWYWCLDNEIAWCDGGPPEYEHHNGWIQPEEPE